MCSSFKSLSLSLSPPNLDYSFMVSIFSPDCNPEIYYVLLLVMEDWLLRTGNWRRLICSTLVRSTVHVLLQIVTQRLVDECKSLHPIKLIPVSNIALKTGIVCPLMCGNFFLKICYISLKSFVLLCFYFWLNDAFLKTMTCFFWSIAWIPGSSLDSMGLEDNAVTVVARVGLIKKTKQETSIRKTLETLFYDVNTLMSALLKLALKCYLMNWTK